MLKAQAQDLEERGVIDLSECFVDATFASAKRVAMESVRRSAARGARSWRARTATAPAAARVGSASPGEVTLVDETLDSKFTVDYPERLIGDMAYDSDGHDAWLREQYGVV